MLLFWSKDPYKMKVGDHYHHSLTEYEIFLYLLDMSSKVYKITFWDRIDKMKLTKWNR